MMKFNTQIEINALQTDVGIGRVETDHSGKAYLTKTHAKFIFNADEPLDEEKAEDSEKPGASKT